MFHGEKLERYLYKYVPNRVLYLLDQARECERLRARTDAYAYRQQAYELAYLMYKHASTWKTWCEKKNSGNRPDYT